MKSKVFTLILVFVSIYSYAQNQFQKGYFIDNNNHKVDCLIKDMDWHDNPTEFTYKLTEPSEEKKMSINTVKVFEVFKSSKFIAATVNIDKSNNNYAQMSSSRAPVFKNEKLFLKVLIEGKANLYSYQGKNFIRFFYSLENKNPEQLIHKEYLSNNKVLENNDYRIQLFRDLKNEKLTIKKINTLAYKQNELINIFINYNKQSNSGYQNKISRKTTNKDLFSLTLKTALNKSNINIGSYFYYDMRDNNIGSDYSFRFGIETEFTMLFDNKKWSVLLEPTYQSYSNSYTHHYSTPPVIDNKEIKHTIITANYSSIELPMGIRYTYVMKDNRFFINTHLVLDYNFNNSKVNINTPSFSENDLKIQTQNLSYAIGTGYKFKNKYSVELRYYTKRNLFKRNLWNASYDSLALLFGYTIF